MAHIDSFPERKTPLDRFLSLAADVRPGEGTTALLMAVNGFLLLGAYYTIRPVRSALRCNVRRSRFDVLLAPGQGRRYPNLMDHKKNVEYDVARVMDIPYADADRVAKAIPAALDMTLEKALEENPALKEMEQKDERVKELLCVARRL